MERSFEEGRAASSDALLERLPSAPPRYLDGALANPSFGPAHLLAALANPAITSGMIQRISANRSWIKPYEVKAATVLHPKTPRAVAMNLVSFLWWRDLVRVSERSILAPPLRRAAERILTVRLQEMAVGEKVTLARIASRGVINALRSEGNALVIRALLQNPRLLEEDALGIAVAGRTPGQVLRALAEDGRWSTRPAVRKAIARHPEAPASVALHLMRSLSDRDLREIIHGARVPGLVKVAARRLIETRQRSRRRAKNGGDPEIEPAKDGASEPRDRG
jgi:hypothetical protein